MKLIYGTHNPSKLRSMRNRLESRGIEIVGLEELPTKVTESEESGKDPLENAREKALTYYKQLKQPVFSCDSGLYFDEVTEEDQPGVWIKRIHGQNLSYEGMLHYYSRLAAKYGGKITAHYKNAICLVMSEDEIYEYDGEELHSEKFYLVETPHKIYKEGYPLDTISVEIESGRYYYDIEVNDVENSTVSDGFVRFFERCLWDKK